MVQILSTNIWLNDVNNVMIYRGKQIDPTRQGHTVSLWRWPLTCDLEKVLFIEIFFKHV